MKKNGLLFNRETGEIITANSKPLSEGFANLRELNNLEVVSHMVENYIKAANKQLLYLTSALESNKRYENYNVELIAVQSLLNAIKQKLQTQITGDLNGLFETRNSNRNIGTSTVQRNRSTHS